jgi:hypothetical protein
MSLLQEEWTTNLVLRDNGKSVGGLWCVAPGDEVCDPVDRENTYGLVVAVGYIPGGPRALVLWTAWVRTWLSTHPNDFSGTML